MAEAHELHQSVFRHGFLILDKPAGISSAKAVSDVKRILGCNKIGHGGTLDPLASGVLPLAIGEATKAFEYIASTTKEYLFTITFGEERATDDAEGETTSTTSHLPTEQDILNVLPDFKGTITQIPPVYSALKINGKPAYCLARSGNAPKMTPRSVEIHDLKLLSLQSETSSLQQATLSVTCGKGTYVRALARDIARKCNSLGYVSLLRRTAVGKFQVKDAILLDKLSDLVHSCAHFEQWVPIELALDDIPAIDLDSGQAQALRHGKTLRLYQADGNYIALHEGNIVALAEIKDHVLRSKRIFNL